MWIPDVTTAELHLPFNSGCSLTPNPPPRRSQTGRHAEHRSSSSAVSPPLVALESTFSSDSSSTSRVGRVVAMRRMEQAQREAELQERIRVREEHVQHANDAKQAALAQHGPQRLAELWSQIVSVVSGVTAWRDVHRITRKRSAVQKLFYPVVLLAVRRWIRRCRSRLAFPRFAKPTVAQLRSDQILRLLSDYHLDHLIRCMRLRYYFPNELVIAMGCEEEECYVLCQGTCDVVVNDQVVATLRPGSVFGSVGMISGEPRTATIVARGEYVLTWVISRTDFVSVAADEPALAQSSRLINVQARVGELRAGNIPHVYRKYLSPSYLTSKFPSLRSSSADYVQTFLTANSTPLVLDAGRIIADATPSRLETSVVYVLRGNVRVMLPADQVTSLADGARRCLLDEIFTSCVEGPGLLRRDAQTKVSALDQVRAALRSAIPTTSAKRNSVSLTERGTNEASRTDFLELGTVYGSVMLNLPRLVLSESTPFRFVCGDRGCDVVMLNRSAILNTDVLELATLRKVVMNMHCPYMVPVRPGELQRVMFRQLQSALTFLKQVDFRGRMPTMTACVYGAGEVVEFSRSCSEALVVVSGDLEDVALKKGGDGGDHMFLWPEFLVVFFGSAPCNTRAKTRVEAFRIPRAELLERLYHLLSPADRATLYTVLHSTFSARFNVAPTFDNPQRPGAALTLAWTGSPAVHTRKSDANATIRRPTGFSARAHHPRQGDTSGTRRSASESLSSLSLSRQSNVATPLSSLSPHGVTSSEADSGFRNVRDAFSCGRCSDTEDDLEDDFHLDSSPPRFTAKGMRVNPPKPENPAKRQSPADASRNFDDSMESNELVPFFHMDHVENVAQLSDREFNDSRSDVTHQHTALSHESSEIAWPHNGKTPASASEVVVRRHCDEYRSWRCSSTQPGQTVAQPVSSPNRPPTANNSPQQVTHSPKLRPSQPSKSKPGRGRQLPSTLSPSAPTGGSIRSPRLAMEYSTTPLEDLLLL